jgi:hypothetical protein
MSVAGMTRRLTVIGLAAFAILQLAIPVRRDVHGLTLVVCAADMQGIVRRLAPGYGAHPLSTSAVGGIALTGDSAEAGRSTMRRISLRVVRHRTKMVGS